MSQVVDSYVARQPVLDVRQRTIGFELLFRSSLDADTAEFEDEAKATAEVIVSSFASLATDESLADALGFVKINHWFLLSDLATALPETAVLCIPPDFKTDEETIERCRALKKTNVKLCLDNVQRRDSRSALFEFVDFVRIDTRDKKKAEIRQVLRAVGKSSAKKIAEKVETPEVFEQIGDLGFDYFQGYHFARPSVKVQRRVDPQQAILIRLLMELKKEVEIEEIVELFKVQVGLGATLLRLVNTGKHSRGVAIESVGQALVMMGRRELERWITLLLFAANERDGASNPLLELAARRGMCIELMAQRLAPDDLDEKSRRVVGDRGFLVGMTSLLDVLLGMTYAEVFEQIPIHADLQAAVTDGQGQLGTLLKLQVLLEKARFAQVERELEPLGITPGDFDAVQQDALGWSFRMANGLRD